MKQEISAIIDQLKANGRWSDAASRIELYWMNGWVQYSSPQCGINFSSADTLAKWLTHNPIEDNHSEEVKTPDEQAFMASRVQAHNTDFALTRRSSKFTTRRSIK